MEFQRFCKERKRMCRENKTCDVCELSVLRGCSGNCLNGCITKPEVAEKIVRKWSDEHPIMTNGQKFQQIMENTFGEAYPTGTNSGSREDYKGVGFSENWWNAEYKEPQKESD